MLSFEETRLEGILASHLRSCEDLKSLAERLLQSYSAAELSALADDIGRTLARHLLLQIVPPRTGS